MESLAVQRQIRENASYLQDYFADMSSWEKSMAKKEQQLQGSKRSAAPVRRAVAMSVRESDGSVSIQHPLNATIDTPSKPTKAPSHHVYDKGYKKWDSFDVVCTGPWTHPILIYALTGCCSEGSRHIQRHPPSRRRGSRGSTPRASNLNSSQESCDGYPKKPSTPPPPPVNVPRDLLEKEDGNMHFKQGEFAAAVNCYSRSLSYNPRNPIVLSNRAMAHLKLQQFGKAEADCTAALAVDGGHVKSLVRRASARNALGKHHAAFADLESALKLDSTSKATIATQLKSTRDLLKLAIKRTPTTKIHVEVGGGNPETPEPPTPKPRNPQPKPVVVAPKIQVKLPDKVPTTAYEFIRVWNSLKNSPDKTPLRQAYLLRLHPANVPKLFKDSIDADLLSELLEALLGFSADQVDFAVEFVAALTRVPRFAMVSMFITAKEKEQVVAFAAGHIRGDEIVAAFT
ncbi:hypothetical protein DYB28_015053 [Aphanomyces astaci]|uniref:RNA polymerase II-associated protein 3 n=3 Tax=Aphanomyces astaci TaxID=112090 RepID=A0A9X8DYV1_APHAT|nr:hypothetical protein DYB28_015053 [Aphanomyces astaci]